MKVCPDPKCRRVMEDSAISCICGYYFKPSDRAPILEQGISGENMVSSSNPTGDAEDENTHTSSKISTSKMPNILKVYMIALSIFCLILIVGKVMIINKTYILNAKRMIISTLLGYGIIFSVVGIIIGRMIMKKSDTSRWILIFLTFPLGLLLIAPSVTKYVSPWEYDR